MNRDIECMRINYYSSKIDWWVYAVVLFTVVSSMAGPLLTHEDYWTGIVLSAIFVGLEIFIFASIKYAIKGDKLGVRMFFRWQWFPIDKIAEVKKMNGILSSAALSVHRVSIKFSDRRVLKSASPLEISPKDRDKFIADLRAVNQSIAIVK